MEPAVELRETLAANIRELADERGISLNALADLAGVGRAHLYHVLYCRKAATIDWIAKVADVLKVEPARLLR